MDLSTFLRRMHRRIPADYSMEIRKLPGRMFTVHPENWQIPDDISDVNYFFSTLPRRAANGETDRGYMVWCDTDGSIDNPDTLPTPSAAVHSGRVNGFHLYWLLDREVSAEKAVQLSRLATLAFKGDYNCCNARFTGRMPFSVNTKHTPPVKTSLVLWNENLEYDPEVLEEIFVAKIFSDHFVDGERHSLTLALAGILIRAAWPLERTLRCLNVLYDLSPGNDLQGKITAVNTTYTRVEMGEAISTAKVRAVLGKEEFINLLTGLGITSRDGDLLIEGEVIGKALHVEREMVQHLLSVGNWSSTQGKLVRWVETHWKLADEAELTSEIFSLLSTAKYVVKGEVVDFPATAKTSRAVSSMLLGALLRFPLAPAPAHLLPLKNGTLDLHTKELLPPSRTHGHTWRIEIDYQPELSSHVWENFIHEAAPNEAIRAHLQEWAGYFLMDGNKWQRMLWLHGVSGTGKSTFIKAIGILLGPSGMAMSTEKVNEYTIAQLANMRAALCGELSPRTLQTSVLKALIAGDPVQARHPYGRPFTVTFSGKFAWGSNALPPLDQGEGMWRRIVPIAFPHKPKIKDDLLEDKLKEPDQASGLLNWAIEGLIRLQGMTKWEIPAPIMATIQEYQLATDSIARFAEEQVIYDENDHVALLEVYQRFSSWAEERGFKTTPLGPLFFQDLRRIGLVVDPSFQLGNRKAIWLKGGTLAPLVFDAVRPHAVGEK